MRGDHYLDHHLSAPGQLPVEVTGGDRGTEVCQLSLGDIDQVILEISDGGVHGVRAVSSDGGF